MKKELTASQEHYYEGLQIAEQEREFEKECEALGITPEEYGNRIPISENEFEWDETQDEEIDW